MKTFLRLFSFICFREAQLCRLKFFRFLNIGRGEGELLIFPGNVRERVSARPEASLIYRREYQWGLKRKTEESEYECWHA